MCMLSMLEVSWVGLWSVIVAFPGHTQLLFITNCNFINSTPDKRQSKTLILSTNVGRKALEKEFSIAICRPSGDKWQSKNTVSIDFFYPRWSIVKSVFDCRLSYVTTLNTSC